MKVLILEDSALLRVMLIDILSSMPDVQIIAEAEDEKTGLALAERYKPDLVIVDLELASGSGISFLSHLRENRKVYGFPLAVVFSNHSSAILRRRCENIGIDAYFDKSYQLDELINFIEAKCG